VTAARATPHRDAIAADASHTPVAVKSGKRKNATFRWASNKRLRNALGIWRTPPVDGNPGPLTATPPPAGTTIPGRCAP